LVKHLPKAFKGIMPMMVTPFKKTGEVDVEQLKYLTDYLVEKGVHGLSMSGSTGEFVHLSEKERILVSKTVIDAAKGSVVTIPCVGAMTTKEAAMYAKNAEDLGADAVLLPPPYYFLLSREELKGYFKKVAESVEIPVVLYNAPLTTGMTITADLVDELAKETETVRFVKESCPDISLIQKTVSVKKITAFAGLDHLILPMLSVGCKGCMTASANIIPEQMVAMWNYFEKGDTRKASELYQKLLPVFNLVTGGGPDEINFVQYTKEAVNLLGINVGLPREPLRSLNKARKEELRTTLEAVTGKEIPKR
jgi:4-hydroxy-tetrahydrodipicolinate synthase